jgi:2-oxo-4-hydroxy-4-carboxy-5-ureidoimidazoline decarboxylase
MRLDFSRRAVVRGALSAGLLSLLPNARADQRTPLEDVNRMDEAAFVTAFGAVYERSPWVAQAAFARRPFASVSALHQTLADAFAGAATARQIKFFHDQWDLGDKSAPPASVSAQSRAEQALSGVMSLEPTDEALLMALNKAYRAKFAMAFTVCVRRNSPARIFSEYMRRMDNSLETELVISLREEFYITRIRIAEMVSGPGMPAVYGDVTAHVLNSMIGAPADGVAVEIHQLWGARSRKAGAAVTNADGRAILLTGLPLPIGRYELRFAIGDYYRKAGAISGGQKPFLDIVPMRIFIARPEDSYHFPLIAAPYGYSIHG